MTEVFGPYDYPTWHTMLMFKENLKDMEKENTDGRFSVAIEGTKDLLKGFISKEL